MQDTPAQALEAAPNPPSTPSRGGEPEDVAATAFNGAISE